MYDLREFGRKIFDFYLNEVSKLSDASGEAVVGMQIRRSTRILVPHVLIDFCLVDRILGTGVPPNGLPQPHIGAYQGEEALGVVTLRAGLDLPNGSLELREKNLIHEFLEREGFSEADYPRDYPFSTLCSGPDYSVHLARKL